MRIISGHIAAVLAAFIVFGVLFAPGCGGDKTGQEKAAPPEVFFDGVLVMRYGDKTNRYEAHITRAAQRLVPLDVENPGAIIIRRDLGVIWNLMPEKKVFLETPIRPEHKNPLVYEPDEILEREVLGEEYVQGIKATKERVVVKNEGAGENTMVRGPRLAAKSRGTGWRLGDALRGRDLQGTAAGLFRNTGRLLYDNGKACALAGRVLTHCAQSLLSARRGSIPNYPRRIGRISPCRLFSWPS